MKIRLRNLRESDAPYMLEWMHDSKVVLYLKTNFMSKSIVDCVNFIKSSLRDDDNLHLAIANQDDMYQGTVSLKNIRDDMAEFAITICGSAMGKGIAHTAMKQMLNIGFYEKNLNLIYWYVSPENKRAIRFYEKHKYKRITNDRVALFDLGIGNGDFYEWFCVEKDEWINN